MKRFIPRTVPGKILAVITGLVILLVVIAIASGSSKSNLSAATKPAASASAVTATPAVAKTKASNTVTFVVTGAPADVTYGHGGSSTHGTSPMRVTEPLIGSATDYTLSAVLGEDGTVKVKIYVNGKLIAHAKATGQYQSAMAVIDKNPFTDQWESSLGS